MRLFTVGAALLLAFSGACQKENLADGDQTQTAASPAVEAPVSTADNAAKTKVPAPAPKQPLVTCDSLGIPSYEFWIKDLADLRCVNCHNENFAWNGAVLTTYTGFKNFAQKAQTRIANNQLTKPLDPIEQGIFLAWFDNKMPNTEADCADMPKASPTPMGLQAHSGKHQP